ncbi:DUF4142 domain-containing protein [Paractinoplanes atraurantiacus]|uniref:Putative membrane protein n=1 Tax=Paractinoplanes atraurantiacus TaxID=1036182 RepID=A0A285I8X2_9ACTN|nr:DUF4142 domain-containing protein [Actinoplanes atraurantiacus]SNY44408.1 putative membrane protein [Actinoplanes atraurantiacus]
MLKYLTAVAAAAGLLVAPARPASAAPSLQDISFLYAAHEAHLFEIAGGRIAETRAATPEVRALGTRFVRDHTAMDRTLTATAGRLGVLLPSEPNAAQRSRIAQYETYDPARFDVVWVLTQLLGHQTAVADGRREIRDGAEPSVVKLAQDAAPVVAGHHQTLISVRKQLQS